MFNRRFMDLVRNQLIRVLAQQARAVQHSKAGPAALRYNPNDVTCFVDLQNLHNFLKHNCGVAATQVHLPNMLHEFGLSHGLRISELHIFTGIHDPAREPQRHEHMAKRLRWLSHRGAKVTALPLSYYTDRETKEVRAVEKGVDVRIASEILRAVNDGLCHAIVVTQDKDIAEAVQVAAEMSEERGRRFYAYSPELTGADWEFTGKCGMHGLRGTRRLAFPVSLAQKHTRPERPREPDAEAPSPDNVQVQGA